MQACRFGAMMCLLVLSLVLVGCSRVELYSALDEHQANEVQAALLGSGIDAQKRRSSDGKAWAIAISRQEMAAAMQVLSARGLPRERYSSMGQIFQREGLVSSPLEERARYIHALQQELADTLSRIDGVIEARVNIALPEKSPLQSSPPRASASVLIIEAPGSNLRERQTDIQAIMTDGVEGLDDPSRVTVKFWTRMLPDVGTPADSNDNRSGVSLTASSASVWLTLLSALVLASLIATAWINRASLRRSRMRYPATSERDPS